MVDGLEAFGLRLTPSLRVEQWKGRDPSGTGCNETITWPADGERVGADSRCGQDSACSCTSSASFLREDIGAGILDWFDSLGKIVVGVEVKGGVDVAGESR